jgi:hypothetical protein
LHFDVAAVGRLEKVDAAEEGALAGARGTEDRDHFTLLRFNSHALENLELAEALVNVPRYKRHTG